MNLVRLRARRKRLVAKRYRLRGKLELLDELIAEEQRAAQNAQKEQEYQTAKSERDAARARAVDEINATITARRGDDV